MTRFDAIKIPLGEGVRLLLTPANEPAPESGMSSFPFLPAGWEGKLGSANSPILYDPGAAANGMHPLAIVEVAAFHWELQVVPTRHSSGLDLHSSLSDSTARNQWHKRTTSGRIHGDFRFTIYLGSAWFELLDKGQP